MDQLEQLMQKLEELKASDLPEDEKKKKVKSLSRKIRRLKREASQDEVVPSTGETDGEEPTPTKKKKKRKAGRTSKPAIPIKEFQEALMIGLFETLKNGEDLGLQGTTGYGFDIRRCQEHEATPEMLIRKFESRWEKKPDWVYTLKQGNTEILIFGPVPDQQSE